MRFVVKFNMTRSEVGDFQLYSESMVLFELSLPEYYWRKKNKLGYQLSKLQPLSWILSPEEGYFKRAVTFSVWFLNFCWGIDIGVLIYNVQR